MKEPDVPALIILFLFHQAFVDTSDWEFPDVCKYYFGKFGQWSSLVFSMVSLIGAMVVYWVLMSNFLYNTGQFIYSKSQFCQFSVPKERNDAIM